MAIYSCMGCVAPKRYPGCHDHCPEYLAKKAEHNRIKAEYDMKRLVDGAIYGERGDKVYKALRKQEKAKKGCR